VTGHALYARLAAISPSMPTMREQAEALGLTIEQLKFVRYLGAHARLPTS